MTPLRFALKEIAYRPIFAALFAASVAVGTASLLALASVGNAAKASVTAQAKTLWTADITVEASPPLLAKIESWAKARWPGVELAHSVETISMAQHRATNQARQISLAAISDTYPLYGEIVTGSGRPLKEVLQSGDVVIGQNLLAQWGITVGHTLRLGTMDFVITDTIARRTDVPTSFFELSPAVLMTPGDLMVSGLLAEGSRARNTLYLNLPAGADLNLALAEVKAQAAGETSEVSSWSTDNPGIFRFLQRTLRYMDFLALLTLTLGGVGAATALAAARTAASRGIGMVYALGAPRAYVLKTWLWWTMILAGTGLVAAVGLAYGLTTALLHFFGDMLPAGASPSLPPQALAETLGIGAAAIALFVLHPLLSLGDIPPNAIFADNPPAVRRWKRNAILWVVGGLMFFGLAWARLAGPLLAVSYVGILAALLVLGRGLVIAVMTGVRACLGRGAGLTARLAARGLARPGNLNDAVVLSVAVSLGVLVTLALLRQNLQKQMIDSFPPEAPNAFFINIQPGQAAAFKNIVGRPDARLHPLVRGRVVEVNDINVREINRRAKRPGDRMTREFGFTYGDEILPTDEVVEGPGLWNPGVPGPQVSVFNDYKLRFGLRLGDQITVNILGRRFTAMIVSFRAINQSVRQPFFYFHFKPGLLEEVPHTMMTGLAIPKGELPALQNRLALALPNVTTVDLADVAELTGRIMNRLARVVGALGVFGLSSGLLLLLSSLLASLAARTKESVICRAIGASRAQVVKAAMAEYALIGLVGAGVAWAMAAVGSAILLDRVFELPLKLFPGSTVLLLGAALVVMVALSWLVTRRAFQTELMEVLRHE